MSYPYYDHDTRPCVQPKPKTTSEEIKINSPYRVDEKGALRNDSIFSRRQPMEPKKGENVF